jgi:hypothetical protein
MFDSLDDQMKHDSLNEASAKERWTRYILIAAVSVVAVGGIFAAVQFIE